HGGPPLAGGAVGGGLGLFRRGRLPRDFPMTASRAESRRLVTNAVFNVAGHLTSLGLAFVLSPMLVSGLGDRRYGLWALVDSILAYLLLFEGGTGASLVRYV